MPGWRSVARVRPREKLVAPEAKDGQKLSAGRRFMEVKESYRILELSIGASRDEVDAAYFRLIERWHPDRAATKGPEAVREAERMVQAITEAHQTLSKIASSVTRPPLSVPATPPAAAASPEAARVAPPQPSLTTPPSGNKPRIAPLSTGQPDLNSPPPKPPPADTWAARSAPATGAAPAPTPAPEVPAAPPPAKKNAPPPRAASAPPPPSPTLEPVRPPRELPESPPTFIDKLKRVSEFYDKWFPVDTARRRYGHIVIAAIVITLLLLGRCTFSSHSKRDREPDPKTTGRLVVKSNLANVTIEANRITTPEDVTAASFSGSTDQALVGLPPGKYAVKAKVEGWPEIHQEVDVGAGHATEVAMNFKGGSLHVDSDPTGASVRLGDNDLGHTPLDLPQLPPGECQLILQIPSWSAFPYKTTITAGVASTVMVRLPYGTVTVETSPPGATILLGGRNVGRSPLTLEHFPVGTRKLTLQAKDFPPLEVSVTVEDRAEVKVHKELASAFPVLDFGALLRNVWVPDNPDNFAPPFDGLSGPSAPRNGVIKNLDRKKLYAYWLRNRYCSSGVVKAYDKVNGQIEFVEEPNEYSKYRVLATLSSEARNDQDLAAQLVKGATFNFYGRLTAVEEPRFLSKVITFEFSSVEPLHE
jgi:hypothetical protein